MDLGTWSASMRRDATVAGEIFERSPADAAVPSCPGWTLADLEAHLAGVFRFWVAAVERPGMERDEVRALDAQISTEPVDRYGPNLDELLSTLGGQSADAPAWTWSSDRTVGFVARRLAHEVSVHRYDAELAIGEPRQIDADLASDGLDELLLQYLPRRRPTATGPVGGSVHVHCVDTDGEWMVRPVDDGLAVTREHAKGDVAARGPASDLHLTLWHRVDGSTLDVIGAADVWRRFVARLSI